MKKSDLSRYQISENSNSDVVLLTLSKENSLNNNPLILKQILNSFLTNEGGEPKTDNNLQKL